MFKEQKNRLRVQLLDQIKKISPTEERKGACMAFSELPDRVLVFRGVELVAAPGRPDEVALSGVPVDEIDLDFFSEAPVTIPRIDRTEAVLALLLDPEAPLPSGFRALPLRGAAGLLGATPPDQKPLIDRALRVLHILQWRRNSVFCGRCGAVNTDAPDELARHCPACGRREYPRISPAVIVLITDDEDRILLAHNGKFKTGMYSLVAGFVEAGESFEHTVHREVKEEVGVDLTDLRYLASQSWPFPESLMIGFRARSTDTVIVPDGEEILDARWFRRDDLPELPGRGSLSRQLIDAWLAEKGSMI